MSQIVMGLNIPTNFNPQPNALVKTSDGKYLIAGRAFNTSGPNTGFALLYDPKAFNPITWQQSYKGNFDTMIEGAAQLKDGNFLAVGIWFTSGTSGDENLWLVKINSADGSELWQKNIGTPGVKSDGYSVTATDDGGFVVTCLVINYVPSVTMKTKVVKFDTDGNQVWETELDQGIGYSIINTSDGGFAVCGSSLPDQYFNSNFFAAKLDASGKIVWQKVYDDLTIYVLLHSDLVENPDGSIAMCGKNVLMKIDASGNKIWANQNTALDLDSIIALPNGSYVVGGGIIDASISVTRAYLAGVGSDGKTLNWDNTELLYNSNIAGITLADQNLVMATGSVPGGGGSQLFIALYDNLKTLFD